MKLNPLKILIFAAAIASTTLFICNLHAAPLFSSDNQHLPLAQA